MMAPRNTLLFRFEALQGAFDNGESGVRLLGRKDERRMNADSRSVTHHDQAIGETALEERDAFLLRQHRRGLLIRHEIEPDQQSLSPNIRDRAMPAR